LHIAVTPCHKRTKLQKKDWFYDIDSAIFLFWRIFGAFILSKSVNFAKNGCASLFCSSFRWAKAKIIYTFSVVLMAEKINFA